MKSDALASATRDEIVCCCVFVRAFSLQFAKCVFVYYILCMEYSVELTQTCRDWFHSLNPVEQEDVLVVMNLLKQKGPHLGFPYSSKIAGSAYSHMHELRMIPIACYMPSILGGSLFY